MSTAYASFPFELPPLLRYDGAMMMGDVRLLQFTELDQTSPSFGASFYLEGAGLILAALAERRQEKRAQFAAAATSEVGGS